MNINTQTAFFAELEKIALDIKQVHDPGMGDVIGKFVTNENVMKGNPALAKQLGLGNKHLLAMAPKEQFAQQLYGDEMYKATKRHELYHYMRNKRGKMARVGTPGLRGLATTAREELGAHLYPMTRTKSMVAREGILRTAIPGTVASVQHAYPGQRLRDVAMGGKAGSLLRRVGKIFKR